MVATWMGFGLLTSLLLAIAGTLLEPVLLGLRRPVRGLWIGLMMLSAAMFVGGVLRPATPARATAPLAVAQSSETSPMAPATIVAPSSRLRELVWPDARIPEAVVRMQSNVAMFDRALGALWLASSLTLGAWLLLAMMTTAPSARDIRGSHDASIITHHLGPAAVGVLRPRILLPSWVLELEPSLRALVIRHEREHLLARDPALLLVATVLLVLLPWQLPLWWMARRLRLAIEFDCDARVLRAEPDIRQYASLLLLVSARSGSERARCTASTPTARVPWLGTLVFMSTVSNRDALKRRIEIMTTPAEKQRSATPLLATVGALALSVLALTVPAPSRIAGAQAIPRGTLNATGGKPSTDSVIVFNYFLTAVAYVPRVGAGQFFYALRGVEPRHDANAGFTTIRVNTVSGRPSDVLLYVERAAGERALKTDTTRVRAPFTLQRTGAMPQFHLRSVRGDTLEVSSPAAVAPPWATKTKGVHFVLWGVNALGVVQH